MMMSQTTSSSTHGRALTSALTQALSSFSIENRMPRSFHSLITALSRIGSVSVNF